MFDNRVGKEILVGGIHAHEKNYLHIVGCRAIIERVNLGPGARFPFVAVSLVGKKDSGLWSIQEEDVLYFEESNALYAATLDQNV